MCEICDEYGTGRNMPDPETYQQFLQDGNHEELFKLHTEKFSEMLASSLMKYLDSIGALPDQDDTDAVMAMGMLMSVIATSAATGMHSIFIAGHNMGADGGFRLENTDGDTPIYDPQMVAMIPMTPEMAVSMSPQEIEDMKEQFENDLRTALQLVRLASGVGTTGDGDIPDEMRKLIDEAVEKRANDLIDGLPPELRDHARALWDGLGEMRESGDYTDGDFADGLRGIARANQRNQEKEPEVELPNAFQEFFDGMESKEDDEEPPKEEK